MVSRVSVKIPPASVKAGINQVIVLDPPTYPFPPHMRDQMYIQIRCNVVLRRLADRRFRIILVIGRMIPVVQIWAVIISRDIVLDLPV